MPDSYIYFSHFICSFYLWILRAIIKSSIIDLWNGAKSSQVNSIQFKNVVDC